MTSNKVRMISTGHALQSLRDSGFDLATAVAEPIDNSIEAGAQTIRIRLDEDVDKKKKKKHIHRIVFADDGAGMDAETLHHYLQIGFSTRYMSKTTIGKYGVGAKLAAMNFAKRIDVWSKQADAKEWLHVSFDLGEALENEKKGEEIGIDAPQADAVPADIKDLLPKTSGTIVVWSQVDRLEEGRWAADANALRVGIEKELSRIFRNFIYGGIKLWVNDTLLLPHDPLFLLDRTWADRILTRERKQPEQGDKKGRDAEEHFGAFKVTDREAIKVGDETAYLTVTVYPPEAFGPKGEGGDKLRKELRIPENQGCLSFVRLEREISYTNVPRILPGGAQDKDRYIGIEVRFSPELDEYFGVRNVKRGVEPHGHLRDELRELLRKHMKTARDQIDTNWEKIEKQEGVHVLEHDPLQEAYKGVDPLLPKGRVTPPDPKTQKEKLGELAEDAGFEGEKAKAGYVEKVKDLPLVMESVSFPGTNFIDIQHLGSKIILKLNTRHRFYRELWEPIARIAKQSPGSVSGEEAVRVAQRTHEALALLVFAYAKAESMHRTPDEQYGDLRNFWGQFLDTMMGKIKNVV